MKRYCSRLRARSRSHALSAPAVAQMNMPGMTMPMPEKKKTRRAAKRSPRRARSQSRDRQYAAAMESIDHAHDRAWRSASFAPSGSADAGHAQMPMVSDMAATVTMAMTGALGSYPMEREVLGHRVAARRVRAHGPDEHERRLDADGPRRAQPGLRPSVRPARRRQGVRLRDADGHGPAAARQRHAAVQGDAQPRPADGQARLSAAAGQRRDRQRHATG